MATQQRQLTCACCGGDAGRFQQFHNQDKGYGICKSCVSWIKSRPATDPERFERTYGKPGINYEAAEPPTSVSHN